MKTIVALLFGLLLTKVSLSQSEFGQLYNGLIYPDSTMKQLTRIVDSLNLKFKVCEFNKMFYSKPINKAKYIYITGKNARKARVDMKNNLPYDEIVEKYNCDKAITEVMVVKYKYQNYKDNEVLKFDPIKFGIEGLQDVIIDEDCKEIDNSVKNKWVFNYSEKTSYSKEDICGYYFSEEFEVKPIAKKYANLIQYADCLIDTNTNIYKENARETGRYHNSNKVEKIDKFMAYVNKATGKPEHIVGDSLYYQKYAVWDSLRLEKCDKLKGGDKEFITLLNDALADAMEKGGTDDEFEEYVGRYVSTKTALELKRSRIVIGGCSMDQSPRIHALNIALLSAASVNWEVFLRAHLDIMNDNFSRVSDGSYAFAGRKTYIKELEKLDINVTDLLIGISLRVNNTSKNHYYGDIGRLGRAFSEIEQRSEFENRILGMVKDAELDEYNRIVMYYLFLNYNYNLQEKEEKKNNLTKAFEALKTLPAYISANAKPYKQKD